jgi:hypothetical protein
MDEKTVDRFKLMPNLHPRFKIWKKMKNKNEGPDWTPP